MEIEGFAYSSQTVTYLPMQISLLVGHIW